MPDYSIINLPLEVNKYSGTVVEMLVEIFQNLTPADRRTVALVCRQFFDASQHPCFLMDRHLHFNYCEIATDVAPVATFMRTDRDFYAITLGYVDCDKHIDEFWTKLGRTVEHLEFNVFCDFGMYLPQVLNRFVALKSLKIDVDFEFSKKFECCMPKCQQLTLSFNAHRGNMAHYENLISSMPRLRHIGLLVYTGSYDALLQFAVKYSDKIKALTFQMMPNDVPALTNTLKCIMKLRKIQLEKLCITYYNNWLVLDEFLDKQENLTHLELGTNSFPNRKYPNMKRFELSVQTSVNSFEQIGYFENLETLIVLGSYGESHCFFGHKKVLGDTVRELQLLDLKDRVCLQCFEALLSSYPNIQAFHSYGNQIENAHIEIILRHATKLKDLKILDHMQVTGEFVYKTPSISDARMLEKLDIYGALLIPNKALLQWPDMINLREIGFGKIFDFVMVSKVSKNSKFYI